MHNHAESYPDLLDAVSNDKVCYVFGAGISRALSSRAVGWIDWLSAGALALKSGDKLQRAVDNCAANGADARDLIALAGSIIEETKSCGVYDDWMSSCITLPEVDNIELAHALSRIPAAHDLVATTNYDLLLERAMGIGTVSWSTPGRVFEMVERGASDSVIHLHGVYAPDQHIDDIVADEYQYSSLHDAKGAQFVQNFIGTRPLVFVGCGATVEDPNVAALLRFMAEELEIDVPYFYLHRLGESLPALPGNVQPIEYGTDYADLTPFLDELTSLKLTRLTQASPLAGRIASWSCSDVPQLGVSGLDAYHYANDQTPFYGRNAELQSLNAMLASSAPFAWKCITGQGGSGKSRLAYELLKLARCDWVGFFLSGQATRHDAVEFTPTGDTLVVVDYVLGRESDLSDILQVLHTRFNGFGFRLRFILLERESDRSQFSWHGKMLATMDSSFAAEFSQAECAPVINLRDLDEASVVSIIGETCRQCGLPPDALRDAKLKESYRENFETLAFRPLYVRMFTQAWVRNARTQPLYTSFASVLEEVLQREQEKWLALFDGNQGACNAMLRLIVRACAGGPLEFGSLPSEYLADWGVVKSFVANHAFPGKQREQLLEALVSLSCHDIGDPGSVIAPSYPCVVREFMLVYYISEDEWDAFAVELWKNSSREFSQVLARGLHDFKGDESLIGMLRAAPDPYANPDVLFARTRLVDSNSGVLYGDTDAAKLAALVEEERAFWQNMPIREDVADEHNMLLNLLKFHGLVLVGKRYGARSLDQRDMNEMMACFREAADIPLGAGDAIRMVVFSELANGLAANNASDLALQLMSIAKTDGNLADGSHEIVATAESFHCIVKNNISVMKRLFRGETHDALEQAKRIRRQVDLSDDEQARLYAKTFLNIATFSMYANCDKDLKRAREYLDGLARERPENEPVRAMSLNAEAIYWASEMVNHERSFEAAALRLQEILKACEALSQGEQALDCWAYAATALLNTPQGLQLSADLLKSAEQKLDDANGGTATIAQAWMRIKTASNKGKGPISLADVQKAHAYFMRFPESETTREAFMDLLEKSVERRNMAAYFDARARAAIAQDALTNPMLDAEAFFEGFWAACDDASNTVRKRPGRNDPCPCGSGKKFKKCCIDKGIYD